MSANIDKSQVMDVAKMRLENLGGEEKAIKVS